MASTTFYADIQKLYVAYFNRPADVAGLQHWQGVLERTNGDLSIVAKAFAGSQEYTDAYAGKSALATVATVYQNLFGHANDMEGMMWWAERLADGRFTVDFAVTEIAKGAQGSDLVAYNNKVTAATAFTNSLNTIAEITGYDGAEANLRAKAFISKITTDASLEAALASMDAEVIIVVTPPAPPVTSYTLTASSAAVDEGKTVYFNLGSTNAVAGSEFTYTISGVDAGDIVGGLIGTVKLDSTGKAVIAVTLTADASTEGLEKLSVEVAGKTATVDVNDVSVTPAPVATYSLSAASTMANEGSTVFFNLDSTNATPGSVFNYTITGVDAADIVGGLTGTVTLDASGKAVIAVQLAADAKTEGVENLTVAVAGKSAVVAVADTSTTPVTAVTYTLTASSTTVDEGGQVTFKLDTTGVAAGTVLSYQLTGIDASRVTGPTAGQVTVDANGQALIVVKTVANAFTDGETTMQLALVNGLAAANVGVNDTSMTSTVFTIDSAKIVASNNTNSPVVITTADTGTATVNIASTSSLFAQNGIVIEGGADITVNMGSTNTAVSNETVYVTGTGANKVVFSRDSSTSVVLGDGDNTVVVNNLTMVAGQTIDFGAGEDTLDVNGTNNFSTGTITGVEHVTMHSSAVFSAAQLNALTSITELGTNGTLSIADAAAATNLDLTGKLFGKMALSVGANVNVTVGAAELANVAAVTTSGTATITTTVAGAQALLAVAPAARYIIADSAANIASAPASVFSGAGIQAVGQTGVGSLTIAQAVAVSTASTIAKYTVEATAAELVQALVFDAPKKALLSANATVKVAGVVTAEQAANLIAATLNVKFEVTDTAAHVLSYLAQLNGAQLTGVSLTTEVTAAEAATLAASGSLLGKAIKGMTVVDTAAALTAAAFDDAELVATTIKLKAGETISVATAEAIKADFGAKFVGGYNLTDTAANIVAKAAIAAGATNVVITDAKVGVAVATQLSSLGNTGTVKYVLTDSAVNLAGASASVLANASAMTVEGNVTVAQATAIAGYAVASFKLVDSAAALVLASDAVVAKALANGGHLTTTDAAVSVSTAAQLYARDAGAIYNVTDSAAVLGASTNLKALDQAGTITVDGTVTIAQAIALDKLVDDATTAIVIAPYAISDTVAAVLAATAANLDGANKVSASGTASIAQVTSLKAITGFDGKFAIVDTAANVAALINTGATGIATLNASTSPVVVNGVSTVAQAELLKSATFTNWNGVYSVTDTVAALTGTTAALRDGALSTIAQDTVVAINNAYAWINVNTDGFVVADTIAELIKDSNEIVVRAAKSGVAAGLATAVEATELFGLNAKITYSVSDTAEALALAANATGVKNAVNVTLTTTATVAQINAITAQHSLTAYTLTDTAANLSNPANAAVVKAAASLTVNDPSVDAATANLVFGGNANVSFTKITDTAANIQNVSTDALLQTGALVVTDVIRLVLNAKELLKFGHTGESLNNVTTTAAGRTSDAVRFDVVDTMEQLATVKASLASAGNVTVVAGGAAVLVADAAAVLAQANTVGSFSVKGNVADLILAANQAATKAATTVTALDNASAADATILVGLKSTAVFNVVGDVASVTNEANAAGVKAAADVDVTDTVTVAQMKAVLALNAAADFVSISDTAVNLSTMAAGSLKGMTVTASGNATLAQKIALDAAAGVAVAVAVSDSASNMSTATAAQLTNAISVTLSGVATAAEAAKLSALDTALTTMTLTYGVKDTAAAIAANAGKLGTTTVEVTTAATAEQAVVLKSLNLAYTVSDSASALLNIDNKVGVTGATKVVVAGNVDVATAALLSKLGAASLVYNVTDTLANLVSAASQGASSTTFNLNAVLGNAASVNIVEGGSIKFVSFNGNFIPTGNIAELQALPSGLTANGYVVHDSVAAIVANYSFAVASKGGFNIVDSSANILASATSLINSAATVTVNGTVSADDATAILAAKSSAKLSIVDSVAELLANGPAVTSAVSVTANTVANAADAASLVALKATAVFSVSDTAANLIGTTGYAKAVSVTVTGASTVADIVTIDTNAVVASYNLTDTAANLAANAAVVKGATAVIVSGADATAAEAKVIYEAKATAVYEITEATIANLFTNGAVNAWVAAAKTVTATGAVSVAQADALMNLGVKFEGSFSVTDTAANFAKASQTMLAKATGVSVTGVATAAEATTIAALTFSAAKTPVTGAFTIADSADNLLLAANATGIAGKNVAINGTATVAQAVSIESKNGAAGTVTAIEKLSDTSTNLQLGAAALVNVAGDIHVTDTQTVAQANFLIANVGKVGADYSFAKITDTVSNVLANAAVIADAASVTMTGKATLAQAVTISANAALSAKIANPVGIADSAANILDAYLDPNFKAFVTGAVSLTVTGTATVAQAAILEGFANVFASSIVIEDTIAAISAAPTVVNLAASVIVKVDVDLVRDQFSDTGMTTSATIKFTGTEVGAGMTMSGIGADGIVTTGTQFSTATADILTLKAGDKLDLSAFGLTANTDATFGNGEYMLIKGIASNGGNTFTADANGTSTLLVWDADTGAGVHASGVILVGQSGNQIVIGEGTATALSIDLTPAVF